MEIPTRVLHKLASEFGGPGKPHQVVEINEWIDTDCVYWSVPYRTDEQDELIGWAMGIPIVQEIDQILTRVRELLSNDPVFVYKGDLVFYSPTMTRSERIVVAPVVDQFEVLRLERCAAMDYGLDTEDVIRKLRELDLKYGIDVVGVCGSAVEFLLKRIPEGEEARRLGEWLLDFCPDLMVTLTAFPGGRLALWWD